MQLNVFEGRTAVQKTIDVLELYFKIVAGTVKIFEVLRRTETSMRIYVISLEKFNVGVTHLSSPFAMIPTLEHNASASSMECVVKIAPLVP